MSALQPSPKLSVATGANSSPVPPRLADLSQAGRLIVVASLVAVIIERFAAVAGDLQLFSDGSWFLIRIASTRSYYFWIGDWRNQWFQSRAFTILGEQTPLVLATHLRVHSLHALSVVFGATLYAHALLALYLCYRYAARRWYVLFPLLSFYAGSMNAEAMQISDSHFILSLYWPVLFILLFAEEIRGTTLVLLLVLSFPMILSYESMIVFGLVLAGACAWRWRQRDQHGLMAVLAAWYLGGVAVSVAAFVWPFDPTNKSGFLRGLVAVLQSDHLAAKVSLVVLACTAALLALPPRLRKLQLLFASAGLLAVMYLVSQVLVGHAPLSLETQMPARVLNLLVPFAATLLLIAILSGRIKPDRTAIGLAAILVGALGLGQAYWTFGYQARWQGMTATLRYELFLHNGPIPYSNSILSRDQLGTLHFSKLHGVWPLMPLSIYESDHGQVQSLVLPPPGSYLPFDPLSPASLPDLSRYGVRYDAYIQALASHRGYEPGQTLTFPRGGSAAEYLRTGWAVAEDWANWTEGQDSYLELPLASENSANAVTLEAQIVPNLSTQNPACSVEVFINGVDVGRWSFSYVPQFEIRTVRAMIPAKVLSQRNPVQIRFHMNEPVKSPEEQGKGADPRKLGLAFLKIGLYPTN